MLARRYSYATLRAKATPDSDDAIVPVAVTYSYYNNVHASPSGMFGVPTSAPTAFQVWSVSGFTPRLHLIHAGFRITSQFFAQRPSQGELAEESE